MDVETLLHIPLAIWNVLITVCLVLKDLVTIVYYMVLECLRDSFPAMFRKSVNGDIVLITGGGSGIGKLIAQKLASLGAVIVTLDVNQKSNLETVESIKQCGFQAFGYKCDLSNRAEVYKVAEKVKSEVGRVTMLINNAGIVNGSYLLDIPDEKISMTFDINVLAHFWLTKAFLPDMIRNKKGHIVTMASLAGQSGANKLTDYSASKFANVGFDEALRTELFVQGHSDYIHTTVICPYFINTGMFSGVQSQVMRILDPEYVRNQCVKAILTNKQVLLLPKWSQLLCILRVIFPTRGVMRLSQTLGFNCAMDQFTGRPSD